MSTELVPASEIPGAVRADLFTAAYGGYFTPVHVDEAALAWMVGAWDLDLARSRVALSDGAPVGFANLGLASVGSAGSASCPSAGGPASAGS